MRISPAEATAFFGFHIWLMSKAMSTIEFCEKSIKKSGYNHSAYDRGLCGNFTEVPAAGSGRMLSDNRLFMDPHFLRTNRPKCSCRR